MTTTEITKQTKILTNLSVVVACAIATFSAWMIYARIHSQVSVNTQDIREIKDNDKIILKRRNDTDNSITRIETKLETIENWINDISNYIKR